MGPATVRITSTPRAFVSKSKFSTGSIFVGLKNEMVPWLMSYLLPKNTTSPWVMFTRPKTAGLVAVPRKRKLASALTLFVTLVWIATSGAVATCTSRFMLARNPPCGATFSGWAESCKIVAASDFGFTAIRWTVTVPAT